jgi:hypothetical protein
VQINLSIAALDNAARDLRFRFGEASTHPPLFTLTTPLVVAHVLGGSHRIEFTYHDKCIVEEVACEPADSINTPSAQLPSAWSDGTYEFRSEVRILSPQQLGLVADQLQTTMCNNPTAIVAQFPGHPHALTAVQIGSSCNTFAATWQTWHLYPNQHEVVETWSFVRQSVLHQKLVDR